MLILQLCQSAASVSLNNMENSRTTDANNKRQILYQKEND